jgi:FkbM family methyltransferase
MSDPIFSELFVGETLLKWQVAHELSVRLGDEGLIVSDSPQYNWHLLRWHAAELVYRLVRVKCVLKAAPAATMNFYVHHFGSIDVAEISLDGTIVNDGITRYITVSRADDGSLEIELEFLNCHPTLSIGCSDNRNPIYRGSGREQFIIARIEVEARDATPELSQVPEDERIRLVDVGGAEGLQLKWMLRAGRITPVMIEPIPGEAESLRRTIGRIPGARVIESALAHTTGRRMLNIAAAAGCSSLRTPNHGLLDRYSIGHIFAVTRTQEVECTRYDELFHRQLVPAPDAIKVDVQGFEYEVLLGFGQLLGTCLGIELECHFYPVYRGQKLIGEIASFLDDFGFVLRDLRNVPNFDGDAIEFDAFFTKRREEVLSLSHPARTKFALLTEVWQLSPHF